MGPAGGGAPSERRRGVLRGAPLASGGRGRPGWRGSTARVCGWRRRVFGQFRHGLRTREDACPPAILCDLGKCQTATARLRRICVNRASIGQKYLIAVRFGGGASGAGRRGYRGLGGGVGRRWWVGGGPWDASGGQGPRPFSGGVLGWPSEGLRDGFGMAAPSLRAEAGSWPISLRFTRFWGHGGASGRLRPGETLARGRRTAPRLRKPCLNWPGTFLAAPLGSRVSRRRPAEELAAGGAGVLG